MINIMEVFVMGMGEWTEGREGGAAGGRSGRTEARSGEFVADARRYDMLWMDVLIGKYLDTYNTISIRYTG